MATAENGNLTFYPAFCFRASPTHFTWVKMAAADVHRLKRRPGFEGQNIFFYLNHPIRFVSLVGIIVARTDVFKRTILTLDDSSGETIEIAVLKAEPSELDSADRTAHRQQQPPEKATRHVAATNRTDLDISPLVPGTVVQAKGTLTMFRDTMQLQLERFFLIRDTAAEMRFVDQRSRYLVEVLTVPWELTGEEVERLRLEAEAEEEQAEEEQERARRRHRKRAEREEKDQRRIQRMWEREEQFREKEAVLCQEAGRRAMHAIKRKRVMNISSEM
ncbi:OB-fold domain-containing protein [Aspergillus novofumigatus IBT 16806]|uniref:CST complex subunit Stn1 N-terminal domain-containing protein n=1 Tax=Aspergillus novofumigatus (strain IBT 16806) TaxID=1392255 RepID=A0A2I1CNE4_ASPN1|nr:uncharacterized protein P174DRAFT_447664 [Aspergillus novofumigatus IBT 16806]PKX99122.1 hypothetical protein P174DRAFT_447664 [Aspergillus novofumigatus IBT 16806]